MLGCRCDGHTANHPAVEGADILKYASGVQGLLIGLALVQKVALRTARAKYHVVFCTVTIRLGDRCDRLHRNTGRYEAVVLHINTGCRHRPLIVYTTLVAVVVPEQATAGHHCRSYQCQEVATNYAGLNFWMVSTPSCPVAA